MCKKNVERLFGQMDYALTSLQRLLLSSDLNIWLSCLLSNQCFLVSNPLKTTNISEMRSGKHNFRTKEDMAENFGTALFARLAIWGYSVYVTRDHHFLPPEYQTVVERIPSKTGILGLTNDKSFPSIKDIQKLLKRSITSLSTELFALFKCILLDFWALQPFAEPMPFEKRLIKRQKDTTLDNKEDSDDDEQPQKKTARNFGFFLQASKEITPTNSQNKYLINLSSSNSTSSAADACATSVKFLKEP
jgi:hypothetical protein